MEGSKHIDGSRLGMANQRLLRESGISVFASIKPDQVADRLSDAGLRFLKRADNFLGDAMLFGRFVADTVSMHTALLEKPKKVLMLSEDSPADGRIAFFAAMVYPRDDFELALNYYSDRVNRHGLVVKDLRDEPVELSEHDVCAIVVGPFKFQNDKVDYASLDDAKSTILLGVQEELRETKRLPMEAPVSTEQS